MNTPQECYVACLDIMGFSDYVRKTSSLDVLQYLKNIKTVCDVFRQITPNINSMVFSDTIAIWTPITSNLNENAKRHKDFLLNIGALQYQCMTAPNLKGRPLRGAITKGEFYFNDTENILFGKAWVEAANIEKSAVFAPRVVVQKDATLKEASNSRTELLFLCGNGDVCVNYLNHVLDDKGKPLERSFLILDHKKSVEDCMKNSVNSTKLYNYYKSVAEYHNWFCAGFGALRQYKITL